jgi:predicted RecB family nuclease
MTLCRIINSKILVAYSQCHLKAFLLLCNNAHGTPHEYTKILEQQRQNLQLRYLDFIRRKNDDVQLYNPTNLKNKHEFLINAVLKTKGLLADCAILNKVGTHSILGRYSYEPTIFVGTYSIKNEQKLELFFVSHVLEQVQHRRPISGRIIGLDEKSHKVKLENGPKTIMPFLEPLQEWNTDVKPESPPLILNKHCTTCQFKDQCQAKAEHEDNLSLLNGISTQKAMNTYEKKGIFTVKQLSYTFKLRKRKKRAKYPLPVTHKPELQALAIRKKKIYLQKLPELKRHQVELFLDIEGIPDRSFYYLIGLLVSVNDKTTYYPFWADTNEGEINIFKQFLAKANRYPDAPIYHYGSFEPRTITKLAKRYDTNVNILIQRLVNINKHVFGKVYFPIYSNRLKEIGEFIGTTWTSPFASGIQSLVWRHHWEENRSAENKYQLLTYNEEDCRALRLLTDELSKIKNSANTLSEVDFANHPKRQSTELSKLVHSQFEKVLKFTHANYDKKKICFRQSETQGEKNGDGKKRRGAEKGRQSYQRLTPKPNKVIRVPRIRKCPKHKKEFFQATEDMAEKTVIDLVFTKSGVRKQITKYIGTIGYCQKCHRHYNPHKINKLYNKVFGHSFQAWVIYQRLFLRLPYKIIVQVLEDQFNERISEGTIVSFNKYFADYYSDTANILMQRILTNPFVHIDETKINIQGTDQYVWVFTDGNYVVLKLTKTREATLVHDILSNYYGVLISDFYPGYDSVKCKQQKCWGHLIRDLNNDLWANPFNTEFEVFILEIRNLILPIMEAVQKYGLKKRNLNKFKKAVEKFYEKTIIGRHYNSELPNKYQKRFIKYQDSLFTFLEHDDMPWHNNTAERSLRHLAVQRKISGTFYESTAHQYLLLLGIMQTCRFQNKSFLKFLLSENKDIDQFKQPIRRKSTKPVTKKDLFLTEDL